MSQENVELVRSGIEAYGTDAYLAFMAEDVEVHPDSSRFPEAKPFRGRDEFRRFLAEIDQGWEGGASCRRSGKSSPWATGSWLGPTGEAGGRPAVSTSAPA